MRVRVVVEDWGWIWGRDWAGMLLLLPETHFPDLLGKKSKSFLSFYSCWGQRFPSRGCSAQGCGPPCPSSPQQGALARGGSVLSPAVPVPMCHPSLAAWELKISEVRGITGCLNISCL